MFASLCPEVGLIPVFLELAQLLVVMKCGLWGRGVADSWVSGASSIVRGDAIGLMEGGGLRRTDDINFILRCIALRRLSEQAESPRV